WTAESIYPSAARLYEFYRKDVLGKPEKPLTVIVSASGVVDLDRPMFQASEVKTRILSTPKGRDRLRAAGANKLPNTEAVAIDDSADILTPAAMLQYLRASCGVGLLLHE